MPPWVDSASSVLHLWDVGCTSFLQVNVVYLEYLCIQAYKLGLCSNSLCQLIPLAKAGKSFKYFKVPGHNNTEQWIAQLCWCAMLADISPEQEQEKSNVDVGWCCCCHCSVQ